MTQSTDQDRHRILLKLEALWNAHPDIPIWALVAELEYDAYENEITFEGELDSRIATEKLSVSGGWQS